MSVDEPPGTTFTELYRDAHREYPTWVEFCLGTALVLAMIPVSRAIARGWSAFTSTLDPTGTLHEFAVMVGGPFLLYLGGFAGVAYAYLRYRGKHARVVPAVPDRRDLTWIGALVLGAVALVVAGELAARVLFDGSFPEMVGLFTRLPPPLLVVLIFALSAVFAGVGVEALFRGAVQGTLRDVTSARVAVGLTTLLFVTVSLGLWSMPTVPELVVHGTSLVALSIALGYAMERTENVLVPMAGYAAFRVALLAASIVTAGS